MNTDDIDVKKLSLEHGDVLVVRAPNSMNPNVHSFVRSKILQAFKDAGTNFVPSVLVCPKDLEFEVLRRQAINGQDNVKS